MSRHVSNDDLVRLLDDANAAQQAHMTLLRAIGPRRFEPHVEEIEKLEARFRLWAIEKLEARFRLWAIEKLEARGLLPAGSSEKEELPQAGVIESHDSRELDS